MDDPSNTAAPSRRRRSDAQRSVGAIVDAARRGARQRPDASVEDIATRGRGVPPDRLRPFPVTRRSRRRHPRHRWTRAPRCARCRPARRPDSDRGAQRFPRNRMATPAPLLPPSGRFAFADTQLVRDNPRHAVTTRLEQIIRRGQRTREFDRGLPAAWLAVAVLGLGHTAADQVASGSLHLPQGGGHAPSERCRPTRGATS